MDPHLRVEEGIVGIRLDGPPDIADRFRVDHRKRGTTKLVVDRIRDLRRLPEFKSTFGGALCVVMDPTIDERRLIDWFMEEGITAMDFLLPDGNYQKPPVPCAPPEAFRDFFIRAFDYCESLGENAPNIRLFDYIVRGLTGEISGLDSLGGDLSQICVIESDGSIAVSDVGRICPTLREDKLNVISDDLDCHAAVYNLDQIQQLSDKCTECEYLASCGGGYLPHRFDGETFKNPSYYCEALYGICDHIYKRLTSELNKVGYTQSAGS